MCNFHAQILGPTTVYSYTTSYNSSSQINALTEDTVNSRLYLQTSCNCGVGPANQWNAVTFADVNTSFVYTPYTYYGPYGVRYLSPNLVYANNKVTVNDEYAMRSFNAPSFSQAWGFNTSGSSKIAAIAQKNDTVYAIMDDGFNCNSLYVYNANTGANISLNSLSCTTFTNDYIQGSVIDAKILGNRLYLVGGFYCYDQFSNLIGENIMVINRITGQTIPWIYGTNDTIKDIEIYNNKIHIAGSFTSVSTTTTTTISRNHFASLDLSGNLLSGTPSFDASVEQIEAYDNYLFAQGRFTTINGNVINPAANFIVKGINLTNNSVMSWSVSALGSPLSNDEFRLYNFRNKLYIHSRKQSLQTMTMEGICLPPLKSTTAIATATTAICDGSALTFSVPAFKYATSYSWSYTGGGGSTASTSNSANFNFSLGATSGKVRVFATSACGGKSDTLTINITVRPRPNAIASLVDDTLNCFIPKVPLLGNSFSPNVGYSWSGPAGYTSSQQNDSTGKYLPGTYVLTVTSFTSGCTRTASVTVRLDTVKPNVTLPVGPYIIPCNPAYLILTGTSTTTPSSLQWYNQAASSTLYPNPDTVKAPGNYVLLVQNLYNGCKNTDTLTAIQNTSIPSVTVTSYPSYTNIAVPADTLTCFQPTLSINAVFSPTNCTIQWKEVSTNSLYPNPITVSTQGNYIPIVTRLDNNCADSSKIIFISQDKLPPNLSLTSASTNINCSYSTATLSAVSSTSNTTLQWTGPSSFNSPNPAVTSVQGWYYVAATNTLTGCDKKDSVNVGYSNTLIVSAGNDILSCKNSPVALSAVVAGTVSPITYLWNSGANTQSTSVSTNTTTSYIVNVSGGGCNGSDTVKVIIPTDIQDSVVTSKGCTGNSGSLVIYAWGGIPPYVYSVNGGAFVSTNTFTNLAFGSHAIVIKDSLGCSRNTSASINQNSNSVSPVFIVSTQNFKGDTVVFVDLTVPKADSVNWILPSIASIIGGDMFSPVVVFGDTGTFAVTMQAYYGTCMISATKNIRILPYDTAYASFTNANGIKTISVNPNPNNGQFTVQVEFYKKQNSSVQVWDATAQKHFQQNFYEALNITLPVNLSTLQNGTYILKVIGEYNAGHFNFVISK